MGGKKYAIILNNSASPAILILTVFLIYRTWHTAKKQLELMKTQNDELKEHNERVLKASSERMLNDQQVDLYNAALPIVQKQIDFVTSNKKIFAFAIKYKPLGPYRNKNNFVITDVDDQNLNKTICEYLNEETKRIRSKHHKQSYFPISYAQEHLVALPKDKSLSELRNIHRTISRIKNTDLRQNIEKEQGFLDALEEYQSNVYYSFSELSHGYYNDSFCKNRTSSRIYHVEKSVHASILSSYMDKLDLLCATLASLDDGTKHKLLLSEIVYSELGRWNIYLYLELRFENRNEHYFKPKFEEMAKIIALKEAKEMTEHWFESIDTKGISQAIQDVANSISSKYNVKVYEQ